MSSNVILQARGLGKAYPQQLTARRQLRYLLPWDIGPPPDGFWALRDVSFALARGEVVGVIGRNGSGKSTLLQLVAGLLRPSEGHVTTDARVAALLELGAGFNPEFTGWENAYVSGAIYGLDHDAVDRRLDRIAAFADIGSHMDQPVKTYSSGMFARLAFAVAIQVDPDVLLVDEILSVGDLGFRARCYRKIEELRDAGASIIFVSHDLNTVRTVCDRVILLQDGKIEADGDPEEVTAAYIQLLSKHGETQAGGEDCEPQREEDLAGSIDRVRFTNSQGIETIHPFSGERCRVTYRVTLARRVEVPVVTLQVKTMLGLVVADLTNLVASRPLPPCDAGDALEVQFDFACNLCAGPYRLGVSLAEIRGETAVPLYGREVLTLEVVSKKLAYGVSFMDDEMTFEHCPGGSAAR